MRLKSLFLAATLLIGSSAPVKAQFSNAGCTKNNFSTSEVASCYNRFTVGYEATFIGAKFVNITFHGFSLKYVHGFGLSKSIPLYVETGLKPSMFIKEDFYSVSIGVPLNIAYRFNVAPKISIQPYTGIGLKVNALATENGYNYFNHGWKRFQVGWQIGLGFNIDKFYVGVEYGLDFMDYAPGGKTSHVEASIGVNF